MRQGFLSGASIISKYHSFVNMFNIALNTFRELVRSRIFALILVFGALLIALSLLLASLSLGQTSRLVFDFGVSMIEISGLIAVVFVGGQMLVKETEGRTIYLILSKPIKRSSFLLGKFFGFATVLAVIVSMEAIILALLLYFTTSPIGSLYLLTIGFIYLKLVLIFAVTLFFSTFSSAILSIFFALGVYIAAHSAQMVLDMAIRSGSAVLAYMGKTFLVILPNFEALSYPKMVYGGLVNIPNSVYLTSLGHALVYLILILILATLCFSRKNFENA